MVPIEGAGEGALEGETKELNIIGCVDVRGVLVGLGAERKVIDLDGREDCCDYFGNSLDCCL